jgi:Tol biopolymer transport system component
LKTLKSVGEPFPVTKGGWYPSVSRDGTLVYLQEGGADWRRLVWRQRNGARIGELGLPQRDMCLPVVSPDGRLVAVEGVEDATGEDIWVHDAVRSTKTRVTLHAARDSMPVWSPNGRDIVFWSDRDGYRRLFTARLDGTGDAQALMAEGGPVRAFPDDWSQDGKIVVTHVAGLQKSYLERKADGNWEAFPLNLRGMVPRLSPDGRFVAYVGWESGRAEIYVQPFPQGGRKLQISQGGGTQARWRRDGMELFYVEGATLMAVPVSTKPTLSAGAAMKLFSDPALVWVWPHPTYDVSADGQRFVLTEPVGAVRPPAIRVVQNWFAEFRK